MKAVMVSSVKGGTGKTLTAVNVAYYLKQKLPDKEIALIDADFDSSNIAEFIGAKGGEIGVTEDVEKKFIPYTWNGIKIWSVSMLTNRDRAVSMRGLSHQTLLYDVLTNTRWGKIDYLVIDQPAGASDIFKSTIELLGDNLVGGIIVTLPITEVDCRRVIKLHLLNEIPVLGVIENMAYFVFQVGKGRRKVKVFGDSNIAKVCEEFNVPFVGTIPLAKEIAEGVRQGSPILSEEYNKPILEVVEKIIEAKPIGLLSKIKRAIVEKVKDVAERVIADFILTVNQTVNIPELQRKYNYPGGKTFDLVLLDRKRTKVISRTHFKIENGKLVVVRNPKNIDFELVTNFQTLARIIVGKKKVGDSTYITYDAMDAWLNDDIQIFGEGSTTRLTDVVRNLLNDEVVQRLREKYTKILEKFI